MKKQHEKSPALHEEYDRESGLDFTFKPPRVVISFKAFQAVSTFTALCPVEINGLGVVERIGNDFLVTEAFVLKQSASSDHADMEAEDLAEFLYDYVSGGGKDSGKFRFQWHSHANGPVYCSGTDISTIAKYAADYIISLVVNKKGDMHCRVDLYKPFRLGLIVTPRILLPSASPEIIAYCELEIREKVDMGSHGLFGNLFNKKLSSLDDYYQVSVPVENTIHQEEGASDDGHKN